MKTLDTQFHKGSYIDAVTKTVMTPEYVSFSKTRKGLTAEFNGDASPVNNINTNIPSNQLVGANCAVEAWFNPKRLSGTNYIFMTTRSAGSTFMSLLTVAGILKAYFANASSVDTATLSSVVLQDRDYHCLFVRENTTTLNLYVNNVLVGTTNTGGQSPSADTAFIGSVTTKTSPFKGSIYKIRTYNHVPTQKERDDMYQEFLNAKLTNKPIRFIEKPKPIDLSREKDAGLIAAYNMKAVKGTLYDISGNGNNGTVVGRVVNTKDGLMFNGNPDHIIGSKTLQAESSSTTKTMVACFKHKTGVFTTNERIGIQLFKTDYSTAFGIFGRGPTNKNIAIIYATPSTTESLDSGVVLNDKVNTVVVVQNGTLISLYVNGVLTATANNAGVATYSSPVNWVIGASFNGGSDWFNGEVYDNKFYNRAFTAEEAKAYHNSFVKPTLLEDFSNYGVGMTPDKWIPISGSYKVAESVATGKYLIGVTNGLTVIQSNQAHGTFEMDFYKSDAGTYVYALISSNENKLSASQQSYSIGIDNQQRVFFGRANSNTFLNNILARTTANYVAINTWYKFRITRTTTGVFTIYIKGGAFTDWTLVSTTGGSGTNPVTDNTYTKSNYLVVNLGTNDRITNIKLLDGIIQ